MNSSHVLAFIPSPPQGVWHVGPVPIRAYALCIILGVIVAVWVGERRWVARGGSSGVVADIAAWAVPFGLVGGRLYHVVTDYQLYFSPGPQSNPWNAFAVWNGGLGIWGAIALGALGTWIACRRRGIPLPALADAIVPGVALAQAIGRWGNWFNQELFGRPTTLPWGLEVDPGRPGTVPGVATYHPTFLYESLWCVGVAVFLVWADRRFRLGHGRVFALYVASYTVGRAWIEWLRVDPAHHILGLRLNDWTSLVVFLGAVTALWLTRHKGREEVVEPRREVEAGESGEGAGEIGARSEEAGADTPLSAGTSLSKQAGEPEVATSDRAGTKDRTSPEA